MFGGSLTREDLSWEVNANRTTVSGVFLTSTMTDTTEEGAAGRTTNTLLLVLGCTGIHKPERVTLASNTDNWWQVRAEWPSALSLLRLGDVLLQGPRLLEQTASLERQMGINQHLQSQGETVKDHPLLTEGPQYSQWSPGVQPAHSPHRRAWHPEGCDTPELTGGLRNQRNPAINSSYRTRRMVPLILSRKEHEGDSEIVSSTAMQPFWVWFVWRETCLGDERSSLM